MPDSRLMEAQRKLTAVQDRLRRGKLGPPLRLADEDLEALAVVGPANLAAAEAAWRLANPGPIAALLDARAAGQGT